MRSIYELSTEEAYQLVAETLGRELPPLEAVENEDWGRDYVLQHLLRHSRNAISQPINSGWIRRQLCADDEQFALVTQQ